MKRLLITAALACGLIASPALAATSTFPIEVDFTRANLDTPEGAAAEYVAIRDQVAENCKAENAGIKFLSTGIAAACTKRALEETVKNIGNDNLTRVHAENS